MTLSYQDTVLADSPVAYWRLDDLLGTVATDLSGNGFDGTYFADAVFGIPSPIETDASSRAINGRVASVPALDSGLLGAGLYNGITYEGWMFWPRVHPSADTATLFSKATQWGVTGGMEGLVAPLTPIEDTWYYFVVTRNGPVVRIYINADLVAERTDVPATAMLHSSTGINNGLFTWVGGFSPPAANVPWLLGVSGSANVWYASGIDEPALYDYALTQAQVLTHYEAAINQILLHGFSNVIPSAVLYSDTPTPPVSFPFRHNWDSPLIERLSFRTNLSRARTGVEEGSVVRIAPRRELEFVQILKNNAERRRLRAQLWAHQDAPWFVPVRQDVEVLASGLTAGDMSVPVTTAYKDYEVGGYIGLRQLADDGTITHWEYQLITGVSDGAVECAPLTYDYSANLSHAYPARVALLDKSVSIRGHAAEVEELTINARLLAENEAVSPNRITVWHPTIKYRDYEVFDPRVWQSNDWDDQREYAVERELTDVDFSDGVFGVDGDSAATETFTYSMKLSTRADIAALLGWFYERAGSARYLWVPTMQRDYEVLGVSTNLLTVEGTNYTDNFAGSEARRDIAFVYEDLSLKFRRVLGSTDDPETLTLDANVPSLTNLKFVSLLKFCRLEADTLELAWETNTVVTATWRFRELTHSPEGTGVSSLSPSASFSHSISPSPSGSPSHSASPSTSPSHSQSPSGSTSPSGSASPSSSASPSASSSVSPSHSLSPSASQSDSPSGSASPSQSPSVSPSHSVSPSVSPSSSLSQSPSGSTSPSHSSSPS